jgi:hypothetical protein
MKRIVFLLVLLVAVVGGVGFYLGWFTLTTQTTADGKSNVTVTVDKDKIKEDKEKAKDKAKELGHDVKDKAAETLHK